MMKSILVILVSAAFLNVAYSDVECFYQKMIEKIVAFKMGGSNLGNMCQEYGDTFAEIRKDIQDCKINKVKVDGVESLVKDICFNDSLKTAFFEKETCLKEKMEAVTCMPEAKTTATLKDQMKYECEVRKQMMDCANSEVGKYCDAENIVKRITDTMESVYVGWCAEVDGASVNKVFFWSLIANVLFLTMFWKQII